MGDAGGTVSIFEEVPSVATLPGTLVPSIPSAPARLQMVTHPPTGGQRLTQGQVVFWCVILDDNHHS